MTDDSENELMTPEESSEMLIDMMTTSEALKSLIFDLFTMLAAIDPDAMGRLRDTSIALTHKVADGRLELPSMALSGERILQIRAEVIEAAMARIGAPHTEADVVEIGAGRLTDDTAKTTDH